MNVEIVTDDHEMDVVNRVMKGHAAFSMGDIGEKEWSDTSSYPRETWIFFDNDDHEMPFVVVDNREGECFVLHFKSLDGAMLFARELYLTGELQETWDYPGAVKDHGGLMNYDEKWVIRVPVGLAKNGEFVFGYVKNVVPHGRTEDVFCGDVENAMLFESKEQADRSAVELEIPAYSADRNLVPVHEKRGRPCI